MQLIWRAVRFKKLSCKFGRRFRFPVITTDGYQVNGLTISQPKKLDGLKRARDLSSSSICDNDTAPDRQLSRHDHNWTRAATKNLCTHVIRLMLRFEMEVRFPAENNQVTAVRMLQNALGWI